MTPDMQDTARSLVRGGMDGVQIISLETAEEVLTERRREILKHLDPTHNQPDSVRELSRQLDRDKGQVSRDLSVLAKHNLIAFDTDGRSKTPRLVQDHIIIEPII